jgi:MoxR-like ATPase
MAFRLLRTAQFEEMGDLHGIPTIRDPTPDESNSDDEYTVFAPPEWVPTAKGPGILLLDDINRADDRILRGIMQLLQNFEWQLPEQWQIVATANPEGADYSVTPMDDAMLTRMLHFTLTFDAKAWAYFINMAPAPFGWATSRF